MRLSQEQITGIVQGLDKFLSNSHAELRLFGSRTNDASKGGDIDLLLIVESPNAAAKLIYKKADLLVSIKNFIGEQKIDLKIASRDEFTTDHFLILIFPTSLLLHKFN